MLVIVLRSLNILYYLVTTWACTVILTLIIHDFKGVKQLDIHILSQCYSQVVCLYGVCSWSDFSNFTYSFTINMISATSKYYCLVAKSCLTLLQLHGLQPTRLLCPWDFSRQNTGVGLHFLQGIFLTQGSNPHLLHWQADSLPLSHQGNLICT